MKRLLFVICLTGALGFGKSVEGSLTSVQAGVLFASAQDHFWNAEFKEAASLLRRAVAAEPGNSVYADWLGKVYDRQADIANPLTSRRQLLRARAQFERAVYLDPTNVEALQDLMDSYLDNSGFGTSDLKRAGDIAERISRINREDGRVADGLVHLRAREIPSSVDIFAHVVQIPADVLGGMLAAVHVTH